VLDSAGLLTQTSLNDVRLLEVLVLSLSPSSVVFPQSREAFMYSIELPEGPTLEDQSLGKLAVNVDFSSFGLPCAPVIGVHMFFAL